MNRRFETEQDRDSAFGDDDNESYVDHGQSVYLAVLMVV